MFGLNTVLMDELKALGRGVKSAFVPPPQMAGPPSGPGGAPQPQAPMPPSPYMDPAMAQAAGAPAGPMPQPMQGGMDPAMMGGGGGGAPGGMDPLAGLAPLIDQRIQAMQAQGQEGGAGGGGAGASKGKAKMDPEILMREIGELRREQVFSRKLLTSLLKQEGKPMPHDILDDEAGDAQVMQQSGMQQPGMQQMAPGGQM